MVAQRQRGEPERAGPALGVVPQAAGVLLGERHAGQLQHLRVSSKRQRQRRLADLGQLVLQPQPPEPQRRVGARGDHEPQRRRRVVQELVEVAVDRVGDLVEVVEHEHDRLVAPVQRRAGRRSGGRPGPAGGRRAPPPPRRRRRGRAPRGPRARSAGGRRRRGRATARRRGRAPCRRRSSSPAARSCPRRAAPRSASGRAATPRRARRTAVRARTSPAVPEAARTSSPAARRRL